MKEKAPLNASQLLLRRAVKATFTNYGKKHHWFMVIYKKLNYRHGRRKYMKFYNLPVDDKIVLFESFMGRQFSCSPKAVYLRMLNDERFKDYTFVWAFKHKKRFKYLEDNRNTIIVTRPSSTYYTYCAQAKYWVTNSRFMDVIKKKDEQVYIQCWHGTPLKRLGYDIDVKGDNAVNTTQELKDIYGKDAANYTYMIAPSDFAAEKFKSAFKLSHPEIVKTIGYPRNDFLLNCTEKDMENIRKKMCIFQLVSGNRYRNIDNLSKVDSLKFDTDKKIILYAPTWRDNQHVAGQGYTYELGLDFDKMKQEFGDEYIILFRAHYFIANKLDLSEYEGFVYDVSRYDDVNELYLISDILITDYSSVFFDYANLKRPILFYMYDYEEYKNNLRDFYIDVEELPGPVIKTQDELIAQLKIMDKYYDTYSAAYEKFNNTFTYLDDGKASDRLIEECILQNNA